METEPSNDLVVNLARDGVHIKGGHNPLKGSGTAVTAGVVLVIFVILFIVAILTLIMVGIGIAIDDRAEASRKWAIMGRIILIVGIMFLFLILALATLLVPGLSIAMSLIGIIVFILGFIWIFGMKCEPTKAHCETCEPSL
jgi:hypothetical protein